MYHTANEITLVKAELRWGQMVGNTFTLVENVITEGRVGELYLFVVQPEYCTHVSCGYEGAHLVHDVAMRKLVTKPKTTKPRCTYKSWRKATPEELSSPALKDVYIYTFVSFIMKDGLRCGVTLFDCSNDKFVDGLVQDGGNNRLVIVPGTGGKSPEFVTATNYGELVENIKKAL